MKLYQVLLACGMLYTDCASGEETPKKSWPVYDSKKSEFIKRERGINESMLNSLENRTKQMLDYYQKVEDREQSFEFSAFKDSWEGGISRLQTLITMIKNSEIIEIVDKAKDVKEKYKPLKKLLTKCNEVYKNTQEGSLERVIKLYDIISKYIKPGEETKDSVSLVDLVNGKLCDCNDITPAYFALLNYYHVNCFVAQGKVKDEEETGLHAWLSIETPKFYFDFDPTWYGDFVPLDKRNEDIEAVSLKEKYVRKKK